MSFLIAVLSDKTCQFYSSGLLTKNISSVALLIFVKRNGINTYKCWKKKEKIISDNNDDRKWNVSCRKELMSIGLTGVFYIRLYQFRVNTFYCNLSMFKLDIKHRFLALFFVFINWIILARHLDVCKIRNKILPFLLLFSYCHKMRFFHTRFNWLVFIDV